MSANLSAVEIKAFVPAKNFELSQQFYLALGFEIPWSSEELAYIRHGGTGFLLQNFYRREHAENFMMHMLVTDVEAWWQIVLTQQLPARFGVTAQAPEDRPWGIRDFVLTDPTGVLWRIGQNIEVVE